MKLYKISLNFEIFDFEMNFEKLSDRIIIRQSLNRYFFKISKKTSKKNEIFWKINEFQQIIYFETNFDKPSVRIKIRQSLYRHSSGVLTNNLFK